MGGPSPPSCDVVKALADNDVRRARVAAQLLHRPGRSRPRPVDLVARLLAVQAQDIGAAPLALRARSRGLTSADVAASREDRSVVRAWGPRGTLHLIAAEDLGWLTSLLLPPSTSNVMRRLKQEGITGTAAQLLRIIEQALAGQGPLTKAQLGERLTALKCPAKGQGIVYLAFLAAIHGRLVLGPDRSNKPTYVYAPDWLGRELRLDGDGDWALAELARRYLRAHAPAGPEDLAAWAGLPLRDARAAWAAIANDLTEVDHGGRPLWRPRRGAATPERGALALLPAFDEYLLGWRDRSLILDDAHTRKIFPGGGILHPAVMADGRLVGRWRPDRDGVASVDLFEPTDEAALRAEIDDVARFSRSPRS